MTRAQSSHADPRPGLFGANGKLERDLNPDSWSVPEVVSLRRGRLEWFLSTSARYVTPGRGLLEDFCKLADAPDERILAYAQRWGVLYVCVHGELASHRSQALSEKTGYWERCELHQDARRGWYWEPTERWRAFALELRALVNIAGTLRRCRSARRDSQLALEWRREWSELTGIEFGGFTAVPGTNFEVGHEPPDQPDQAQIQVDLHVNGLLEATRVHPQIARPQGRARIIFGGRTLAGALVTQLLLVISDSDRVMCTSCRAFYRPKRQPAASRRNYCPRCRKRKIPLRDAKRDQRARAARTSQ